MLQTLESNATTSDSKLEQILALKTHIKKDSIDLNEVPMYLHIIMKGLEIKESGVSNVSFNALSYLIKRVSVQDPSGKILKEQSFLILPVLINKLGSNNVVIAKKALEDYWLSTPVEVENAVNEISFTCGNLQVTIESIQWMHQIVKNVSLKFNVRFFVPAILKLLSSNQDNQEFIDCVGQLFDTYIQVSTNSNILQYLKSQCKSHNIGNNVFKAILPGSRPSSSEAVSTRLLEKKEVKQKPIESCSDNDVDYFSTSLTNLLNKANYDLATSIKTKDVSDGADLGHIFDTYFAYFEGKESESNWKKREQSIVEIRTLLRGNAATSIREDLVSCLKAFAFPICKGASSLRTTLCTHSCQLIKECAIILQTEFEPCADLLFPTLMKLCLSTKSITSTNAHMAMSALYANLNCNNKLFQRICQSMDEPNFKPRSFAAIWMQILLLRYAVDHSFFNGHYGQAIDTCNKLLIKLLKDANPNVRQVSKDCYWCFSKVCPEESDALITRFDANTIRALQRSQKELGPMATTTRKLSTRATAPPIKESAWDRIQGMNQSKPASRSASRESNTVAAVTVLNEGKPIRFDKQALKNESNRPTPRASSWNAPHKEPVTHVERARSRTEVLTKSPVEKEDEVVVRHSASEPPADSSRVFSRDQDPMIELMSSKHTNDLTEGVKLLKYAIISKEDVSNAHALKSRLRYISEKNPMVLKQLFTSNDYVFKTAAKLLSLDDFVRVYSIVFPEIDQRIYELAAFDVAFDDFYNAELQLLGTVIDSPNIPGSTCFKFLISTYQFKIAKLVLQTFLIALTKTVFTDVQFGELFQELVRLIVVLKGLEAYADLKQLFCQLYAIDSNRFTQLLDEAEFSVKDEVELIVGIDSTVALENPLDHSVFEMTEINPGILKADFVPQSAEDGFTMVVPKLRNDETFEKGSLGQIEEAGEDVSMIVEGEHVLENEKQETPSPNVTTPREMSSGDESVLEGVRPFKLGKLSVKESVPFPKPATSHEPQEGLVEDMALIHIEYPATNYTTALDAVQTMIEKADPLASRAQKNKRINIYEDTKRSINESRNERNMDTIMYYHQLLRNGLHGDALAIDQFNHHCDIIALIADMGEKIPSMASVCHSIASLSAMSFEFREYFLTTGKHKLTSSLWEYFELGFEYGARPMTQEEVIYGSYLLQLLLRYDESIDVEKIFSVLSFTCKYITEACDEVYLLWTEILTLIIKYGSNTSSVHAPMKTRFETMVLKYLDKLESAKLNQFMVQLCLYFLSIALSQDNSLNEEKLCQLDSILGKFLTSKEAEVRSSAVVCYGSLLKNESLNPDQRQVMARLKSRYPIAKQRLIEEYSK